MRSRAIAVLAAAVLVAGLLAACEEPAGKKIDLVVSRDPPVDVQYCATEGGKQNVYVTNLGPDAADPFNVEVMFYPMKTVVATPYALLPAGATEHEGFTIPAGCYVPDCEFTITIRPPAGSLDSNPANNTVNGRCIG